MTRPIKEEAVDAVARAIGHYVLFPPNYDAMSIKELQEHVGGIALEAVKALVKADYITTAH